MGMLELQWQQLNTVKSFAEVRERSSPVSIASVKGWRKQLFGLSDIPVWVSLLCHHRNAFLNVKLSSVTNGKPFYCFLY